MGEIRSSTHLSVSRLATVPLQLVHRFSHVAHVPKSDSGVRRARRQQELIERVECQAVDVRGVGLSRGATDKDERLDKTRMLDAQRRDTN